ncbi:hypothetical protein [Sphingobium sp. SYK-6]|nr:hypothetical protein [Sphingobium sp. SYK-6]
MISIQLSFVLRLGAGWDMRSRWSGRRDGHTPPDFLKRAVAEDAMP